MTILRVIILLFNSVVITAPQVYAETESCPAFMPDCNNIKVTPSRPQASFIVGKFYWLKKDYGFSLCEYRGKTQTSEQINFWFVEVKVISFDEARRLDIKTGDQAVDSQISDLTRPDTGSSSAGSVSTPSIPAGRKGLTDSVYDTAGSAATEAFIATAVLEGTKAFSAPYLKSQRESKDRIDKANQSIMQSQMEIDHSLSEFKENGKTPISEFELLPDLPETGLPSGSKPTGSMPKDLGESSSADFGNYQFKSKDKEFIKVAEEIRNDLAKANTTDPVQSNLFNAGRAALLGADEAWGEGDIGLAKEMLSAARTTADLLLGLDPVTGFARDLCEFIGGTNIVTGEELSFFDRVLAGVGVITAGTFSSVKNGTRALGKIAKFVPKGVLLAARKGEQIHHILTNKSKKFTPWFENMAKKYGLDLNEMWNKVSIPHGGPHVTDYHLFIHDMVTIIDQEAKGDKALFLELFNKYIKEPILKDPGKLYSGGWKF